MDNATWFRIVHDPNSSTADIERAIMCGADVNWHDCQEWNCTALHKVTRWNNKHCPIDVAELLIRHGARLDICHDFGDTPAMLCKKYYGMDHGDLYALLIGGGESAGASQVS